VCLYIINASYTINDNSMTGIYKISLIDENKIYIVYMILFKGTSISINIIMELGQGFCRDVGDAHNHMILHAVDDDRRVACLMLPVHHSFKKFKNRCGRLWYFRMFWPTTKLQKLDVSTLIHKHNRMETSCVLVLSCLMSVA